MSQAEHEVQSRSLLRAQAAEAFGIPLDAYPRHIAIIMDGNGRWARRRGLPRSMGHHEGAVAARSAITECRRLGIEVLTLYSFSLENWKRSDDEIGALMALAVEHLIGERDELRRSGIRLRQIGRRHPLPHDVLTALDAAVVATAECTEMTLVLALNYGSRAEITDALRAIAEEARAGVLDPAAIDEQMIAERLNTAGLPDPDMIIRTAGERRLSNFLLWQASYAELVVSDVLWPDFREGDLRAAIEEFAGRERRFGAVQH